MIGRRARRTCCTSSSRLRPPSGSPAGARGVARSAAAGQRGRATATEQGGAAQRASGRGARSRPRRAERRETAAKPATSEPGSGGRARAIRRPPQRTTRSRSSSARPRRATFPLGPAIAIVIALSAAGRRSSHWFVRVRNRTTTRAVPAATATRRGEERTVRRSTPESRQASRSSGRSPRGIGRAARFRLRLRAATSSGACSSDDRARAERLLSLGARGIGGFVDGGEDDDGVVARSARRASRSSRTGSTASRAVASFARALDAVVTLTARACGLRGASRCFRDRSSPAGISVRVQSRAAVRAARRAAGARSLLGGRRSDRSRAGTARRRAGRRRSRPPAPPGTTPRTATCSGSCFTACSRASIPFGQGTSARARGPGARGAPPFADALRRDCRPAFRACA